MRSLSVRPGVRVALALVVSCSAALAHGGGHTTLTGPAPVVRPRGEAGTAAAAALKRATLRGRASPATTRNISFDPSTRWEVWWDVNRDAALLGWDSSRDATTRSGWISPLSGRGRPERSLGEHESLVDTEIVPALQSVLRREDDQLICDSAVISLGRVCAPELAPFVLRDISKQLEHPMLTVQTAATLALGVLGAPAAQETLQGLAADTSSGRRAMGVDRVPWQVRGHAAVALGLLGDPASVDILADLVRHAPSGERDLRASAALALGLMHGESDRAGQALMGLLREDLRDHVVASWVPIALGKLEDPTALPTLLAMLESDTTDRLVRASTVVALGRLATIQHGEIVDRLIETLDVADSASRNFAFISLARIGARPVLKDDPTVRERIETVLRREVERPSVRANRPWAALACGLFGRGNPERRDALGAILLKRYHRENGPSVRAAFALGLGLLRHQEAADEILADFLSHGDRGFRGYAALSLGMLGSPAAVEPLLETVVDESIDAEFRMQVSRGLAVMGLPLAADVLLQALAVTNDDGVSWSMATALGRMADPRSIWPLIHMLEDDGGSKRARAFAALSLGLVGERAPPRFTVPIIEDINYLAAVDTIHGLVQL